MTVDHDGQIRMDCSSPYAMAGLVGLKDRFRPAAGCRGSSNGRGWAVGRAGRRCRRSRRRRNFPPRPRSSAAVRVLSRNPHVFVTTIGTVTGVVTRDDVQKPAGRMWLFGMVTMIELALHA